MFRVIVIDDERAAGEALARLLKLDGYEVARFTSATSARSAIESEPFDAIVTDLEMPDLHGLEIVRAAQRVKHAAPVFVVSAYAGSPVASNAVAAGARRVFSKPLDYDELSAALAEVLAP